MGGLGHKFAATRDGLDEKALDALDALDEAKHLHATLTEAVEAAEMRHKDATESQKLAKGKLNDPPST